MIVDARIRFKDILAMLDVKTIPGCDDDPHDWIDFIECVYVDEDDFPPEACDVCGGVEPEPEAAVNPWLIKDFVAAIQRGDIHTAQQLVCRVFETVEDVATVDSTLSRAA